MVIVNIDVSIRKCNRCIYLTINRRAYNFPDMEFSERLKAARLHAQLTQAQLAEATGVAQPTISYLENSTATGSEFTARFARICGVSCDWLADEIGVMVPVVYSTSDPKLVAALRVMEPMPEFAKDAAVKSVAEIAQLVAQSKEGGNGTDG